MGIKTIQTQHNEGIDNGNKYDYTVYIREVIEHESSNRFADAGD
jgi:hypothetical protein